MNSELMNTTFRQPVDRDARPAPGHQEPAHPARLVYSLLRTTLPNAYLNAFCHQIAQHLLHVPAEHIWRMRQARHAHPATLDAPPASVLKPINALAVQTEVDC